MINDNNVKWRVKKLGEGVYLLMVGATDTKDGQGGLVPAPSAGDNNKYLRGDGTWKVPALIDLGITSTVEELNYAINTVLTANVYATAAMINKDE